MIEAGNGMECNCRGRAASSKQDQRNKELDFRGGKRQDWNNRLIEPCLLLISGDVKALQFLTR